MNTPTANATSRPAAAFAPWEYQIQLQLREAHTTFMHTKGAMAPSLRTALKRSGLFTLEGNFDCLSADHRRTLEGHRGRHHDREGVGGSGQGTHLGNRLARIGAVSAEYIGRTTCDRVARRIGNEGRAGLGSRSHHVGCPWTLTEDRQDSRGDGGLGSVGQVADRLVNSAGCGGGQAPNANGIFRRPSIGDGAGNSSRRRRGTTGESKGLSRSEAPDNGVSNCRMDCRAHRASRRNRTGDHPGKTGDRQGCKHAQRTSSHCRSPRPPPRRREALSLARG